MRLLTALWQQYIIKSINFKGEFHESRQAHQYYNHPA